MTIWWLAAILGVLGASGIAFIWLMVRLGRAPAQTQHKTASGDLITAAEDDVEHIFNTEFREELRNRGRLHFEKIIGENAMFLQQDLRLTTSQLNEYMKAEITKKLQEEFDKYEQSIMDAKQLAIDSIEKTNKAIDEQRQTLGAQVQSQIDAQKAQLIQNFTENMTDIINHYLNAAIANQVDLSDQTPYIVAQMEENKAAILEDIQRGA